MENCKSCSADPVWLKEAWQKDLTTVLFGVCRKCGETGNILKDPEHIGWFLCNKCRISAS